MDEWRVCGPAPPPKCGPDGWAGLAILEAPAGSARDPVRPTGPAARARAGTSDSCASHGARLTIPPPLYRTLRGVAGISCPSGTPTL